MPIQNPTRFLKNTPDGGLADAYFKPKRTGQRYAGWGE
jgi:hypothetical protein